jgi:hypothetical protein
MRVHKSVTDDIVLVVVVLLKVSAGIVVDEPDIGAGIGLFRVFLAPET